LDSGSSVSIFWPQQLSGSSPSVKGILLDKVVAVVNSEVYNLERGLQAMEFEASPQVKAMSERRGTRYLSRMKVLSRESHRYEAASPEAKKQVSAQARTKSIRPCNPSGKIRDDRCGHERGRDKGRVHH